jgi:hypothetical protein
MRRDTNTILEQAHLQALADARASCPARTKIQYKGSIKEFIPFCTNEFEFEDGDTEAKSNLFLWERVIGRICKKGKNKGKPVSPKTVENHVSAVVSLYNDQRGRNLNGNDYPQCKIIKSLLETIARLEHSHRKSSFIDRGIGTMLDTYTPED